MRELERVRYIAEQYEQLQGLRLIPLGLLFLGSALSRQWTASQGVDPVSTRRWVLVFFAVALASSYAFRAYYHRRFGRTRALPARTGAATLVGCFVVIAILVWVQDQHQWLVSVPILFVAAVLARLGLVAHRLRVHYLWIAAACIAFALLGPLGASVGIRDVAFDVLIGGGLLVAGFGDHYVLRRALHESGDDGYAQAV